MANQTIPGLSTISSPSSAALMWIADPGASPQDRSFSLANLLAYLLIKFQTAFPAASVPQRKIVSTSGALGVIAPTVDTTYIFTAASTATLPASPIAGQQLTFKAKTTATSTISANSGQTIGTTSSTAFILYAQEDYVTLEWDGTSIWYVVATNGPVQTSLQTAGVTPAGALTAWIAMGSGFSLGTLAPGVYDIEMLCQIVLVAGQYLCISIGNGTTPISEMSGDTVNAGGAIAKITLRGYVLTAAATIQGLYYTSSNSNNIGYSAANTVGCIIARRIG